MCLTSLVGLEERAAIWHQIQPDESANFLTAAPQSSLEQSLRTAQGVRKDNVNSSDLVCSTFLIMYMCCNHTVSRIEHVGREPNSLQSI